MTTMTREAQREALEEVLDEDRRGHADHRGGDPDLLGDPPDPHAGGDEPPVDLAAEGPDWFRRREPDYYRVALGVASVLMGAFVIYSGYRVLREELS